MFGIKKMERRILEKINNVIRELNEKAYKDSVILSRNYVECAQCGVLVNRSKATKVQKMVDETENLGSAFGYNLEVPTGDKTIKTEYFCKAHNPINQKQNESEKCEKQGKSVREFSHRVSKRKTRR